MRDLVTVIGGGPAGSLAALAALDAGAPVRIFEKSRLPRHKVCGEFLSPEAGPLFERFGLLPAFLALKPARVTEARIRLGNTTKTWSLKHPAYGISRYALDRLLLDQAIARGAELIPEQATTAQPRTVVAHGRRRRAPKGSRLFGFKAHFQTSPQFPIDPTSSPTERAVSGSAMSITNTTAPFPSRNRKRAVSDAAEIVGPTRFPTERIDLLFAPGLYVGMNRIEGGATNVCGLVNEPLFKQFAFDADCLLNAHFGDEMPAGNRMLDWLITGPLVHGPTFEHSDGPFTYRAGDALGFIDPFTGSGMLDAICTGALAGRAAALGAVPQAYEQDCRRILTNQYRTAAVLRKLISVGIAGLLAPLVPGTTLFQLTRPAL